MGGGSVGRTNYTWGVLEINVGKTDKKDSELFRILNFYMNYLKFFTLICNL